MTNTKEFEKKYSIQLDGFPREMKRLDGEKVLVLGCDLDPSVECRLIASNGRYNILEELDPSTEDTPNQELAGMKDSIEEIKALIRDKIRLNHELEYLKKLIDIAHVGFSTIADSE